MKITDFGNNEQMGRGIVQVGKTYVAMTFTQTRTFKTLDGAVKFLAKFGLNQYGERV